MVLSRPIVNRQEFRYRPQNPYPCAAVIGHSFNRRLHEWFFDEHPLSPYISSVPGARIPDLLPALESVPKGVTKLFIVAGCNDLCPRDSRPEEVFKQIRDLVRAARDVLPYVSDIRVLVLPHRGYNHYKPQFSSPSFLNHFNRRVDQLNRLITGLDPKKDFARPFDVGFSKYSLTRILGRDGTHPNRFGSRILSTAIKDVIGREIWAESFYGGEYGGYKSLEQRGPNHSYNTLPSTSAPSEDPRTSTSSATPASVAVSRQLTSQSPPPTCNEVPGAAANSASGPILSFDYSVAVNNRFDCLASDSGACTNNPEPEPPTTSALAANVDCSAPRAGQSPIPLPSLPLPQRIFEPKPNVSTYDAPTPAPACGPRASLPSTPTSSSPLVDLVLSQLPHGPITRARARTYAQGLIINPLLSPTHLSSKDNALSALPPLVPYALSVQSPTSVPSDRLAGQSLDSTSNDLNEQYVSCSEESDLNSTYLAQTVDTDNVAA
jgi:lysophospholipase L1-like esterase